MEKLSSMIKLVSKMLDEPGHVPNDPIAEDDETMISNLVAAVSDIQNRCNSLLSFVDLYGDVHRLSSRGLSQNLYSGVINEMTIYVTTTLRENIISSMNTSLLLELDRLWQDQLTSLHLINSIFMYLDGFLFKADLPCFYDVGLEIFRKQILFECGDIKTRLQEVLNGMILAERSGEMIEHVRLRSAIDMLLYFDLKTGNFVTYKNVFEDEFLIQSEYFYANEAKELINQNNAVNYIKKYKMRVEEEKERVARCLHESTESRLISIITNKMLHDQLDAIYKLRNGIETMIKDLSVEDLKELFGVYKKYGTEWEKKFMNEILEFFKRESNNILLATDQKKCQGIMEDLLQFHNKLENICEKCFTENSDFRKSLNTTLTETLDANTKTPEYLCEYMHSKLTKLDVNTDDSEVLLNRCCELFRNLTEKDIFIQRYKTYMLRRIVNRKMVSIDVERQVITKLKAECGMEFTKGVENLISDCLTSNDLRETFKNCLEQGVFQASAIDLHVTLLSAHNMSIGETSHAVIPLELTQAFSVYEQFYDSQHAKRKLTIHPCLGNTTVKSICGKKTYNLEMTTPQTIVILLFNKKDKYTFEEIQAETGMDKEKLIGILKSFCLCKSNMRLLRKISDQQDIDDGAEFIVNDKFKPSKVRVKIPTSGCAQLDNKEKDEKKVEHARVESIEAALVRIMKTKRRIEHQMLIIEVINQLKQWFQPQPAVIKVRIERLIEKEYMRKSSNGNGNFYEYIA